MNRIILFALMLFLSAQWVAADERTKLGRAELERLLINSHTVSAVMLLPVGEACLEATFPGGTVEVRCLYGTIWDADRGKQWLDGDRICVRWEVTGAGNTRCSDIYAIGKDRYEIWQNGVKRGWFVVLNTPEGMRW